MGYIFRTYELILQTRIDIKSIEKIPKIFVADS